MAKSIRILSIDDSRAVHAFLDRSLSGSSYHLTHAMSARAGIDILKIEGALFGLILLDWEMPDQNGPEALAEIRRVSPSTPVIMVSSKNAPEDIQKMIMSGASDYIMKPFTPDILLAKIEAVLGVG